MISQDFREFSTSVSVAGRQLYNLLLAADIDLLGGSEEEITSKALMFKKRMLSLYHL